MLTVRLSRLGLFIILPLVAKVDLSDWSTLDVSNEEEALFVRRIADFWQEGEYAIAKNQMEEFLVTFPDSQFSDPLRVSLGDILLREKNYSGALASYAVLSSSEFADKAFLNRMQCLYHLEWYMTLADECEEFLAKSSDNDASLKATFYLAIALYRQCLNATKEPEILAKLAKRAEPHFETLLRSELSSEVAQSFAHLCCIVKEYQKAADIYLDLAVKEPLAQDEMQFQAALIQTEYDKNLALESFKHIAIHGQRKAREAAYNHLVLSFELGHYEDLVQDKESILGAVPEDKREMSRLLIGKSLLALKRYSEAMEELTNLLSNVSSLTTESISSGILALMEAAHQSNDIETLDKALAKLTEIELSHGELAKGHFLRCLLLKNAGRTEEAREGFSSLLTMFPDFPDRATTLFESADLEYKVQCWDACRSKCLMFLEQFPNHELAPFAWRYLAGSSNHLSNETSTAQERFANDLEMLLEKKELFSASELCDWTCYLGRAYFNLGRFEQAASLLETLLQENTVFPQEANAYLLLGLCYRDGQDDTKAFCKYAEMAIAKNTDLIAPDVLEIALFNAYLLLAQEDPNLMEKSAEHLYRAFEAHAEISQENLRWLGEWYFEKQDESRASKVFTSLLDIDFDETACYRLGLIYSSRGEIEDQIVLLEKVLNVYLANPEVAWKWEPESKVLLAEGYLVKKWEDKAVILLNEVTKGHSATKSETIAKAYLEKARIFLERFKKQPLDQQLFAEVASQFKDLILQKRLEHEPIHLEAALAYVDLLENTASNPVEKRLILLEKIKKDFESSDDLLSKDYQQARLSYPDKNRIFENYMKFIDAEIFMAKSALSDDTGMQKELQAKAKDLLLQIKSEYAQPTLLKRVASRLQSADVSFVE